MLLKQEIGTTELILKTNKTMVENMLKAQKVAIKDKIEPGCFVILFKDISINMLGYNTLLPTIRKEQVVGEVLSTHEIPNLKYANVSFNNMRINCDIDSLKIATEEQTVAFREKLSKQLKEIESKVATVHVPYTRRDIEDLLTKQFLNTNYNFVNRGTWNEESDVFNLANANFMPTCCALTKTTSDLQVFIPTIWLQYYGYSTLDMQRYLKFLEGCDIGFKYKYIGVTPYQPDTQVKFKKYTEFSRNPPHVLLPKDEFHQILIKGSNNMTTYLHFILVRYLYNMAYWNIPATALQIKFKLKDKITNFQALLLAHSRYSYNSYYSLAITDSEQKINIYQDPKIILNKLKSGETSMNNSFSITKIDNNITRLIKEKKYKEAFELFNSKK